jgi:DNA invertase Pin-like site-specific DNA recombinase
MSALPHIRCAIYTRKSSDDGPDQEFNSLDEQVEACAAYVASQRHEGWRLLPARYDDGGLPGGTHKRPALQRLMADIDAGRFTIRRRGVETRSATDDLVPDPDPAILRMRARAHVRAEQL